MKGSWSYSCQRIFIESDDDDERIIKIIRFRWRLVPIIDAVLEEFEWSYHHLLHCFSDVRSLVEPIARIEEIRRV